MPQIQKRMTIFQAANSSEIRHIINQNIVLNHHKRLFEASVFIDARRWGGLAHAKTIQQVQKIWKTAKPSTNNNSHFYDMSVLLVPKAMCNASHHKSQGTCVSLLNC